MDKKHIEVLKTFNKNRGASKRTGKKYVQFQRNGCPPGLVFDFRTNKCKKNTAVFLEALERKEVHGDNRDIKVLDKYGVVVDIPLKEAYSVTPWILRLSYQQIDEINYLMAIEDIPKIFHSLEEKLGKDFYENLSFSIHGAEHLSKVLKK